MKKKGTIGLVATLGLGLCAYALSQQAPVKEDKKNQNQVQYLQGDKKKSASNSNKQEESIETVNSKEKTQAEQIVVKITDEGFVTSHGDHFHYYNGKVPYDAIFSDGVDFTGPFLPTTAIRHSHTGARWLYYQEGWELLPLSNRSATYTECSFGGGNCPTEKRRAGFSFER